MNKKYGYQSMAITIADATGAGTPTDTNLELDSSFDRCTGISYYDSASSNNFYVSLSAENRTLIDALPNAQLEVGANDTDQRFLSINTPAKGKKITVRVAPIAASSGETTIIMSFRLESDLND